MALQINIFLKSFWLKQPPIGLRKILLTSFCLATLALATKHFYQPAYTGLLILNFGFLTWIATLAYFKGFYHRITELSEKGDAYEVFDLIFPASPKRSTRNLGSYGKYNFVLSSAFKSRLENKKRSAYLDIVPNIFKRFFSKAQKHNSLIFGGGSYSLPLFLVNNFPKHVTKVVEPMTTHTEAAEKYFYPLFERGQQRITTINATGQTFLSQKKPGKYNFVLLDAFVNEKIVDDLLSKKVLQKLTGIVKPRGIILINFYTINSNLESLLGALKSLGQIAVKLAIFFNPKSGHTLILLSPNRSSRAKYSNLTKIGNYSIIQRTL